MSTLQELIKTVGDNRIYLSGKNESELACFCITEFGDILFVSELTDADNVLTLAFDDFFVGTVDDWKKSVVARVADRKNALMQSDAGWSKFASMTDADLDDSFSFKAA